MDYLASLPLQIVWLICGLVIAGSCGLLLSRRAIPGLQPQRIAALEGVRGFLAMGVFLHHAQVWRWKLQSGKWEKPPLSLNLGEYCVALFFMITAFLFVSKLVATERRPIDWGQLYRGRIMRIYPLFCWVTLLVLVIIFCWSHGVWTERLARTTLKLVQWFAFADRPNFNGRHDSGLVTASVTWTLFYEWWFYLSLPLLAFAKRIPKTGIAVACSLVAMSLLWHYFGIPKPIYFWAFLAGAPAVWLVRLPRWRQFLQTPLASGVAIICGLILLACNPTAWSVGGLLLLSIIFTVVAGGNSFFGILEWRSSLLLGHLSYSIYLQHGLFLFITFTFICKQPTLAADHWRFYSIVLALIPILLAWCWLTYRWIELPAMRISTKKKGAHES